MSLSKNAQGQVTLELNPEEVEAYVKAGIDRRLAELFRSHAPQPLHVLVRSAVQDSLADMLAKGHIRTLMHEAVAAWLDKREGWISAVLVRGHVKKAPRPDGRGWTQGDCTGKGSVLE